jgi:hypothetical protein
VSSIENIISGLNPVQLAEAEKVKLFDRTDSKYIFNLAQLPGLLEKVSSEYRVLEVNGIRNQPYRSLYFDTADFQLYYGHHNGRSNRYKVRIREYTSTHTYFLEIKFKTNQDRTIKKRCTASEINQDLQEVQKTFLASTIPFSPSLLHSTTWTNFNRITLIHKSKAERVTIDTSPQWIFADRVLNLPSLVITEVKRDKMSQSNFALLLKESHIRENGFSKYCIGNALIGPHLRYNMFKPTLLSIQKICKNELPALPSAAN